MAFHQVMMTMMVGVLRASSVQGHNPTTYLIAPTLYMKSCSVDTLLNLNYYIIIPPQISVTLQPHHHLRDVVPVQMVSL